MDTQLITLFPLWIIFFLVASTFHEFSHALVAYKLGDDTARLSGRLTLNPIAHIDPAGIIILIFTIVMSHGSYGFGWAKPVPFNPYQLRHPKAGIGLVALAGPLSNFILAVIGGLLFKIFESQAYAIPGVGMFFFVFIWMNIILAGFNLIPIPPLDGSKILFSLLPYNLLRFYAVLERYSTIIFILLIITPPGRIVIWFFVDLVIRGLNLFVNLPPGMFGR